MLKRAHDPLAQMQQLVTIKQRRRDRLSAELTQAMQALKQAQQGLWQHQAVLAQTQDTLQQLSRRLASRPDDRFALASWQAWQLLLGQQQAQQQQLHDGVQQHLARCSEARQACTQAERDSLRAESLRDKLRQARRQLGERTEEERQADVSTHRERAL
jgi:uncharacterized phage infection (PIP) family protein YhgE